MSNSHSADHRKVTAIVEDVSGLTRQGHRAQGGHVGHACWYIQNDSQIRLCMLMHSRCLADLDQCESVCADGNWLLTLQGQS